MFQGDVDQHRRLFVPELFFGFLGILVELIRETTLSIPSSG